MKELEQTFRDGAVAVKIYKSIGMELRSRSGKYLMPDDPVLDPILDTIAARNKTLFAHIAEPIAAWQPLDPASPDYGYYRTRPVWHMHGHPERPSKEAILGARDRMLKRHPKLRVVGCHLGSMEENVEDIAQRFDEYPNFAVDTAARIEHLALQNREKVRGFLISYQDRVLYATDLVTNDWDNAPAAVKKWEAEYARTGDFSRLRKPLTLGVGRPRDWPCLRVCCENSTGRTRSSGCLGSWFRADNLEHVRVPHREFCEAQPKSMGIGGEERLLVKNKLSWPGRAMGIEFPSPLGGN